MIGLNGKYGFINREDKIIIDCVFDHAFSFSEEFAMVRINEKAGFINKAGELVIDYVFDRAMSFSEDLATVKYERRGLWGYIDKNGKLVLDCIYDLVPRSFSSNIALVKINGKPGYINKEGTQYWED